ncbi:MAG: NADH-quinone oxidoreductase subunit NuoE family protein [Candidatus Thorarchaeota archaeon]|jgi:NADH-quinone oxidoreductase subunit E
MLETSREALVSELIPYLQEIQLRLGYIPREAIQWLADEMHLSEQDVYGVATFYKNFRFSPPGKHQVKMCMGTACFVQGGENLLAATTERLGISPGETTPDQKYSLERVACLGCCALAPVVVVDDEVHGKTTQRFLSRLFSKIDKQDKKDEDGGTSK